MKLYRTIGDIQGLLRNQDVREQAAAFGSQLVLNLSFFGIMLAASLLLEVTEFARLSLVNGYIMMLAMVLDLGLNQTCLKLSIERNEPRFVDFNLTVKVALFGGAIVVLGLLAALGIGLVEGVVLASAASVALWTSARVLEQYHRRFWRYAALNLALAASRVLFAGLALISGRWIVVAIMLHIAAQLPVHIVTLKQMLAARHTWLVWSPPGEKGILRRLAPGVFLNGVLYTSLPVISQTAIFLKDDAIHAAAFGIVLLFLGPLSLVVNTLRIYIMPQVLSANLASVNAFGLGRGSMHILAGAFGGLFLLSIIPISFVLVWVFGARYPQIGTFFAIYFGAHCITDAVGLYNMRALRENLIWVSLAVAALRVAFTAPILLLPQVSALTIVAWSAAVLVIGELLLAWLLTRFGRDWEERRRRLQ